jgi:hypothetical protein
MTSKAIRIILAVGLAVVAAWVNIQQLVEAFGEGPPYYGRTTNMDKWESPVVFLLIIDLVAAALIVFLLLPLFNRRSTGASRGSPG